MNYKLTQKAYQINFDKIDEGYLYSERLCYAENHNKARAELFSQTKKEYESLILKHSDEEITYLTIPVVRCKSADKYQFEGKELTLREIEETISKRERELQLAGLLQTAKFCYIMKRGQFYKPNSSGYTNFKWLAGIYTIQEGVSDAKSCEDLDIIPIDIKEHNSMIEKGIEDLKTRFINP